MKKEMLINVLQPEECRIAIVEDGVLEELYVERTSQEKLVGNIYKGRIVNIEPSIQAAFIDFGVGRNGFLHVSDVEPQYYRHKQESRDGGGRRQPPPARHWEDIAEPEVPADEDDLPPTAAQDAPPPAESSESPPQMPFAEHRTKEEEGESVEASASIDSTSDSPEQAVRDSEPEGDDHFDGDSAEPIDRDDLEVMDVREEMEEQDRPPRQRGGRRGRM